LQLAISNEGQRRYDGRKVPINAATDGFSDGFWSAFEWYVRGIDARSYSEFLGIDVCGLACACGCEIEGVGFGFDFGHEVFDILEALAW
jgi:hypothetical protein